MLPWILCVLLVIVVIALIIKIWLMQKGIKEICACLSEHLSSDTNRLIAVSSGDRHVRHLASEMSNQLAKLRKAQLKYVNGDRELKEAVTNISHDLRTPLTAICGYLDLLEAEEKTDNAKRYVKQIANRTEALKALTDELFRYSVVSSISDFSYEKVDVGKVLEDTLISFYGAFEQKNITPRISLPNCTVSRNLDKSALSRIFGNIVNNAVKYSDGDFSVTMSELGEITFTNTASELSTVDAGRLFDRFYTVDSARKSTGLGLSIAKLLTERMNGMIDSKYENDKLSIIISFKDKS